MITDTSYTTPLAPSSYSNSSFSSFSWRSYGNYLQVVAGSIIAGPIVYTILSLLLIPPRITIPASILVSTLIFGLARYYADIYGNNGEDNNNGHVDKATAGSISVFSLPSLLFVAVYAACLVIVISSFYFASHLSEQQEIFIPWKSFSALQLIQLGAAIALCFFLPGFALVSVLYDTIDRESRLLLKALLAYIFSTLLTGMCGLVAGYLGFSMPQVAVAFIVIYVSALLLLIVSRLYRRTYGAVSVPAGIDFPAGSISKFLKRSSPELVVFASLLGLVVLSTYYLYGGAIVGDQWYHHGRSLAFISGEFRDISAAHADENLYPPFLWALLASFFTLSSNPSVNAYASISFLNIMSVCAFYYFFKKWIPSRMKGAALIGSTMFMLSSGFGWVSVLDLAIDTPPTSQPDTLEILYQAEDRSDDVITPTSFGAAHPDYSTSLTLIALPVGFTLLGLLREKFQSNLRYVLVISSISFLGVFAHAESYLFVITASIIPLFSLTTSVDERKKHVYFYLALLVGLLVAILTGIMLRIDYMSLAVAGTPLVNLCIAFVAFACILYLLIKFFLNRLLHYSKVTIGSLPLRISRPRRHKDHYEGTSYRSARLKLAFGMIILFLTVWIYIMSFNVLGKLPVEDVDSQTGGFKVPWYLYPMKLGITGLLGLAFALSYFFKRFEKEIFVLGLVAVVAFFAGPYYDEHRFSKYIMAGLAGFGSLFILNFVLTPILHSKKRFKVLASSITMGLIVLSSSLSILMFWGYNALTWSNPTSDSVIGRRDFPSPSEFSLFDFLRSHLDGREVLDFNIAAPHLNGIDPFFSGGLVSKLQAFVGMPWNKLEQSPYTLDASTLEGFYDLLDHSSTRYIVLPKTEGQDKAVFQGKSRINDVLRFASEHFHKAYENDDYVALDVPTLSPSSLNESVALVYPQDQMFPYSSALGAGSNYENKTSPAMAAILPFNLHSFRDLNNFKNIEVNDENNTATLLGYRDKKLVLWSSPMQLHQKANYIESTFRINAENKSGNHAGIIWDDGAKEYSVSIKNDGLEILERTPGANGSNDYPDRKLINVREFKRENNVWYTLKIATIDDLVKIYLNDFLVAEVPKDGLSSFAHNQASVESGGGTYNLRRNADQDGTNAGSKNNMNNNNDRAILRVGLFSFNNIAEFKPLQVGEVSVESNKEETYYRYFYPLSMLALSKIDYDTFMEGDLSALSKKTLLLTLDSFLSSIDSTSINNDGSNGTTSGNGYLKFANEGGTLIITDIGNSNTKNEGLLKGTELSELFPIRSVGKVAFDSIVHEPREGQQFHINVSGVAKDIELTNTSPGLSVKSFYLNAYSLKATPFAIEKEYGSGRVVLLNSGGYFDAIAQSPQENFPTLANVTTLMDVTERGKNTIKHAEGLKRVIPVTRFIGDLEVSGDAFINSSSFSILPSNTKGLLNNTFIAGSIASSGLVGDTIQEDSIIRELKLSGLYEVIIKLKGSFNVPFSPASYYDYVAVRVPSGFDAVLRLQEGSTAEFLVENDKGQIKQPLKFGGEGEIHFYNVRDPTGRSYTPVLLKAPEIHVTSGKTDIDKLYAYDPSSIGRVDSNTKHIKAIGRVDAKIVHFDHYSQENLKGTRTDQESLTYLDFIDTDQAPEPKESGLKLPAGLSDFLKKKEVGESWRKAIFTNDSIIVSISVPIVALTVVLTKLWRPRWLNQ